MKKILYLWSLFVLTAFPLDHMADASEPWQTYQGAWFAVDHPTDFRVTPSQQSSTGEGYDSVVFASPDDTVSFYVFAPQWTGEAADIALDPRTETLVAERSAHNGKIEIAWRTIAAKDGSYQRSYQDTFDPRGPSFWTIGIRYTNTDVLARWREHYDTFKRSLQLHAD